MQRTIGILADENPAIVFESHLRRHAWQYFKELGGSTVDVQLVLEQSRSASKFYKYIISAGEQKRSVLIKTPPMHRIERQAEHAQNGSERPRMASVADPRTKQLLEYTTLTAIQRHFEQLGDARFGVINTLDYLPEYSALIMEELRRPNLRKLFVKKNRLQLPFNPADLRPAFRNAGAWLRLYQALPKEKDVQTRHATREAFSESIIGYTGYLQRALREESFLQLVESRTLGLARALLVDELPMGLGHGDYAMRNILVGEQNCVTVVDTLGRWRVPIFEDLAYFLVRLKAVGPQMLTMGNAYSPAQMADYEKQFLLGYFGAETVPLATIRLFEIQALLDHWSATAARLTQDASPGELAVVNKVRLAYISRFFQKLLCTLIDCRTGT